MVQVTLCLWLVERVESNVWEALLWWEGAVVVSDVYWRPYLS